jgi:hypothetical protein
VLLVATFLGGRGRVGVVVALLTRLDAEEVDGTVVRRRRVGIALQRQLHPAVCKGVVLAVPVDLGLRGVRVDGIRGGPRALLAKANDLGCAPQYCPPASGDTLLRCISCVASQ